MRLEAHLAHISFNACLVDEIRRVHLQLGEFHLIHHHLVAEQRHQLHIHHHLLDVSDRIFLGTQSQVGTIFERIDRLQHLHSFHSQFKRKDEFDILHRYIHTCRFRSVRSYLLYRPILNRRQIKHHCEQEDEEYRSQQDDTTPFHQLLHRHERKRVKG